MSEKTNRISATVCWPICSPSVENALHSIAGKPGGLAVDVLLYRAVLVGTAVDPPMGDADAGKEDLHHGPGDTHIYLLLDVLTVQCSSRAPH